MNEKIKELIEQAKEVAYWTDGGYTPIYHTNPEKLAELLIQKCVAISDDYVKDCTCEEHVNCKHPQSAIGRKIREYFGVER